MPAYNFKTQFADAVENGEKRQTIRKTRKHFTQPGDTLYLYTGMRTKRCRKLREVVCRIVHPITIRGFYVEVDGWHQTHQQVVELARADGFDGPTEFFKFFHDNYGDYFNGVIIKW